MYIHELERIPKDGLIGIQLKRNSAILPRSTDTTYDNYCTLKWIDMSSISLYSQMKMLLYNINYIIVNRELFQVGGREIKNQLFNMYFLIQDISLNNTFRSIKL